MARAHARGFHFFPVCGTATKFGLACQDPCSLNLRPRITMAGFCSSLARWMRILSHWTCSPTCLAVVCSSFPLISFVYISCHGLCHRNLDEDYSLIMASLSVHSQRADTVTGNSNRLQTVRQLGQAILHQGCVMGTHHTPFR